MLSQILIPLFIFLTRVADVTLGTIRIIFVSRGIRILAAVLGFCEVFVWLFAITRIMQNLDNIVNYFAYAAGFGMGNFVGITIERSITKEKLLIRIITKRGAEDLVQYLSTHGYGITAADAEGSRGPVKVIFTVIKRKALAKVLKIIKKYNPQAFYTIEDIRFATERNFLTDYPVPARSFFHRFSNFFLKRK